MFFIPQVGQSIYDSLFLGCEMLYIDVHAFVVNKSTGKYCAKNN